MRGVLIFGATATLVQRTLHRCARAGDRLHLVARNPTRLEATAANLRLRYGAEVTDECADLVDFSAHEGLVERAFATLGSVDVVLVAHGALDAGSEPTTDPQAMRALIDTNFVSVAALTTLVANRLVAQQRGVLAVVSSVAGDRGRPANYVYGASKGALSLFLQGLRGRLHPSGVRVITIKPGPADTPMTRHLRKSLLFADADVVGEGIYRALSGRRDVVYLPWFWRWIMTIVRSIPEAVFKRLVSKAAGARVRRPAQAARTPAERPPQSQQE